MKIHSLTRQTITIVLAAQLLSAVTLSTFAVLREGHTRLHAFDVTLQGRSDSLLGAIQDAENPEASVQIDPAELRLPPRDAFAVYNQGGAILGSSPDVPLPLVARGQDGFRTVTVHGTRYRVLQREAMRVIDRAEFGGIGLKRPVTIVYAARQNHVLHDIVEAAGFSLLAIFLVATSTVLLVGLLLRRALTPLAELAVAASQVSAPTLRFDPPVSALQTRELRPLAEVLSASVTRVRLAFEKEQQFVGDAAHELKTAIAVVRSSIQVLMMKRRSPQEYEAGLERALQDNLRVESLVTRMLQLASVTGARTSSAPPLDLSAIAEDVLQQLHPLAEERGISLHSALLPGACVPLAPEGARALMTNLLLNAIQHSAPGMVVRLAVERRPPRDIVLTVADSGCGIGASALPHIFDRFFREDQSRSRETGGTGLGLSICKSIVESAGGTIHAASTIDTGTTMRVIFSAP